MIYLQFIIGFLLYLSNAYLSYNETLKTSKWFYPLGLSLAIAANFIWLSICKMEGNAKALMFKGLFWDALLTAAYLIIPLLVLKTTLTPFQIAGVSLVIIGLMLLKL